MIFFFCSLHVSFAVTTLSTLGWIQFVKLYGSTTVCMEQWNSYLIAGH